jgi:hypothetical protein
MQQHRSRMSCLCNPGLRRREREADKSLWTYRHFHAPALRSNKFRILVGWHRVTWQLATHFSQKQTASIFRQYALPKCAYQTARLYGVTARSSMWTALRFCPTQLARTLSSSWHAWACCKVRRTRVACFIHEGLAHPCGMYWQAARGKWRAFAEEQLCVAGLKRTKRKVGAKSPESLKDSPTCSTPSCAYLRSLGFKPGLAYWKSWQTFLVFLQFLWVSIGHYRYLPHPFTFRRSTH